MTSFPVDSNPNPSFGLATAKYLHFCQQITFSLTQNQILY